MTATATAIVVERPTFEPPHPGGPERRDGPEPPPTAPAPEAGNPSVRRRRTKADYLDTALVLADERASMATAPYAYAVGHVDMAHVAEVAGVSRTALYRLWDTQEAFRADLTAYLATHDEAPWMDVGAECLDSLDTRLAYPDPFLALARDRLDTDQAVLATDPRPLLRAGIAGYPLADPVASVIARRERERLERHAALVERALWSTGRRCRPGIVPTDISVLTACLADGLALAVRMIPPSLPLMAGRGSDRPWSLLALGGCTLFDGLTEPDPHRGPRPPRARSSSAAPGDAGDAGTGIDTGVDTATVDDPGGAGAGPEGVTGPAGPTGRRLDYLRLAAELATAEHPHDPPSDCGGLGYVGLDVLARAEGVTRAAVRKMWPTQAAFRSDLFAHLLSRHRLSVVRHLSEGAGRTRPPTGGGPSEDRPDLDAVLRQVGDTLLDQAHAGRDRVCHLALAPQLVLPAFRAEVHRHVDPLLDRSAVALTSLLSAHGRRPRPEVAGRRLAVLLLALIDGATRVVRTDPELVRPRLRDGGPGTRGHGLLGIALDRLVRGLSRPAHPCRT